MAVGGESSSSAQNDLVKVKEEECKAKLSITPEKGGEGGRADC
jgi:hypothetical protein